VSFSGLHKLVAYLLSGLGLLALSLGTEVDAAILALIALGYVGSIFAEGKLIEHPHYGRAWTVAVVALLAVQVLRSVADAPTLAMAIEFAAFLQISRLWNRRAATDYQQIAVLAFLHLIAATVLSSSLSYAALFFGFVIVTPWMLALSQLRREIEGNYHASGPGDERAQAAVRRVLASKRVVGASFLVNTALLALPLFAMTLVIFVIVPRVGQGFLSLSRAGGQKVAGFGSEVELGGFGVIRDDPTVVLRVTHLADGGAPRQLLPLRMRGTSFDHYDGRRWSRTMNASVSVRPVAEQYPLRRMGDPDEDLVLQIVLDRLDEPVVFLPRGTVSISVPPRLAQGRAYPRTLRRAAGMDVRYADPDDLGLMYTVYVSDRPDEQEVGAFARERKRSYLQVPAGHERIAELAKRVVGDATEPTAVAERLVRYLHSSEFGYSLEQPDVKAEAPLVAFLFTHKRGHCEYFASAMAIMLRTLGVPSRNVTGFAGGRFNPYGNYYALRQGDAHSWVEAYVEGYGWIMYDPTPPSREAAGLQQTLWTDVQALVDAVRTRWMTSVVGYDLRTQVSFVLNAARFFSRQQRALRESNSVADAGSALKQWVQPALVGLGVLALVALLAWFFIRRRASRAGARALSQHAAQARKLYEELEGVLRTKGQGRPASRTPEEHARVLEAQHVPYAAEVRAITTRYMAARYGDDTLDAQDLARLRSAIAKVKATEIQRGARTG
jgi:protein-glutamine gamma-glutamyltransferase